MYFIVAYKEQRVTFYQIYSDTYSLLFVNKNVSLGFIYTQCSALMSTRPLKSNILNNISMNTKTISKMLARLSLI